MVVTVTSMKGGVGKTTIAAMLARYLTLKDQNIIVVVDMDPQGGASSILLGVAFHPIPHPARLPTGCPIKKRPLVGRRDQKSTCTRIWTMWASASTGASAAAKS